MFYCIMFKGGGKGKKGKGKKGKGAPMEEDDEVDELTESIKASGT